MSRGHISDNLKRFFAEMKDEVLVSKSSVVEGVKDNEDEDAPADSKVNQMDA